MTKRDTWKSGAKYQVGLMEWLNQKFTEIEKMHSVDDVASITVILQRKSEKKNRSGKPPPAAVEPLGSQNNLSAESNGSSGSNGSNESMAGFSLKNLVIFGTVLLFLLNCLVFMSAASSGSLMMSTVAEKFSALLLFASQNFFDNPNHNATAPTPKQTTKAPSTRHSQHQEQFGWEEAENEFMSFVQGLKTKYGSQSEYGLAQIDAAISSTMTEERPGKPTCLVFLTPPTVPASFTSCYAREIGLNVNSIFSKLNKNEMHPVLELGPVYWDTVSSVSQVHRDLDTYFETMGKVVIMDSVDKLNTQDQLRILHAYCDNAKAPDTRATLLFPLKVEQDYEDQVVGGLDWKEGNGYRIAKAILNSAWTSLSNDARPAIIDRVTATVVLIRPGDECHSA